MSRGKFGMDEATLLSRDAFKTAVFARAGGRCVFCARPAVDPHHVLERKLYPCGGYYLGNGAAVCEAHHWDCETTRISVETVRRAAGIEYPVLPPCALEGQVLDKWGNRVWPNGLRTWGPLESDAGARKALAVGGFLGLMMPVGYAPANDGVKS